VNRRDTPADSMAANARRRKSAPRVDRHRTLPDGFATLGAMTEPTCDLHAHSTASDGTDPPETFGALARQAGLSAVALTDHDTTAGLEAAARSCEQAGVTFVPGIEISCDPQIDPAMDVHGRTLHLLGLFIEPPHPLLESIHRDVVAARAARNPQIIERLQGLGVKIEYDELLDAARRQGTAIIGRPLIGQLLVDKGLAADVTEAFRRFIGSRAPAYVRRDPIPVDRAIEAVHAAGGLAILAHPIQLRLDEERGEPQVGRRQLGHSRKGGPMPKRPEPEADPAAAGEADDGSAGVWQPEKAGRTQATEGPGRAPEAAETEQANALWRYVARLKELGLDGLEVEHSDHSPSHVSRYRALARRLGLLESGGSDYHGGRKSIELGSRRVPATIYERLARQKGRTANDS